MVDDTKLGQPSPWQPTTSKPELAVLGKLIEELGECVSAASRCVIQGIDKREPMTGRLNREWLEDELADVAANIDLVVEYYNLDRKRLFLRKERKISHLMNWRLLLR